ncbi:TRAP transporter small permease [Pseudooceanicola aestuarii]|uniref:TRAP transporter small permease n=1 Tax=Pseudooceanicola aestuarii TaxID=2697319 RepID=UPI0013D85045|nr:TRAP transporter small permease [Pseudooceanicola aestuarii]
MYLIGRILAVVVKVITWTGMVAIILMMTQITADVAGKLLFNQPLPGTIALVSNYYMVFVAFIPLAFVETRNGHITVEVVTEFLPRHVQRHLYSWTYLLSAVVFGLLAYQTGKEAMTSYAAGTFMVEQQIKVITWPSYFLLPVGCGLMTLVVVYRWGLYATGARSGLGEVPTV